MTKFEAAYNITSKHEGGYANVKKDKGGETYRGISRRYHPDWTGWAIIDDYKKDHVLKRNDFIDNCYLDLLVRSFYKEKFWNKFNIGIIDSQDVANFTYDSCVLCGSNGVHFLQDGIDDMGIDVINDGIIGPQTSNAVKVLIARNRIDALVEKAVLHRIFYHEMRVKKDPDQKKFLSGWKSRATSFIK